MKIFKTIKTDAPVTDPFEGDQIIFRTLDHSEEFHMRELEFDWLMEKVFEKSQKRKCEYIQITKEWNECKGFMDIDGIPSLIKDIPATIEAFQNIEFTESKNGFWMMSTTDLQALIDFLKRNEPVKVEIFGK